MRAHFNRPLLDRAGNQVDEARVRLLMPGTTEPIAETIYVAATGGQSRTNPWTIANGEIDFYLDSPARVQVGVTIGTAPEELWNDVDVFAVATDSSHPGSGAGSMQVGLTAAATGLGATAAGDGAAASADQATAVGRQATASHTGTVAAGSQAAASQAGAVAVGQSALATGTQATAVGDGARAPFDHSVALGAGAQTTRPDQVVLGTPGSLVTVSGSLILRSPGGSDFTVSVTDDGLLLTQKLSPYQPPSPSIEGEGQGESGT